jgi:hypothetical protein
LIWRSRQSGANLSLAKFPANREFNRGILKILTCKTALLISKPDISEGKYLLRCKSEQGINRGTIREFQGLIREFVFPGLFNLLAWTEAPKTRVY